MSVSEPTTPNGAAESRRTRILAVDALARVEGEGALRVVLDGDVVTEVALRIYEPPRFFEGFLQGRHAFEAPDLTSRICGICPIAYQTSAVNALESLCGATVDGPLRDLRRLLYCGEWIESHALHIAMLHAPDFLGCHSVIELAERDPHAVQRSLRLKKAGNQLARVVGGREIHPINLRVGGFYRVPQPSELHALTEELTWARDAALDTVRWVAGFDFPDLERDWELVSLRHPGEYPITGGRLVSTGGLDIDIEEFDAHFAELQVPHSTALHCRRLDGRPYLTGPLARYALNFHELPDLDKEAARDAGLGPVCRNPFKSIIVRAVELVFAVDEALALIARYTPPPRPAVEVVPRAGAAWGASEAPRGTLLHRYEIGADGLIRSARILPPTAQNQASLEDDLRAVVSASPRESVAALTHRCEHAIRNHDPCISCATHFLRLELEHRGGEPCA
jgi:sulfhydrogenase subunit alpha